MNYRILFITLLSSLVLASCSHENGIEPILDDGPIELSFRVEGFVRDGASVRATDVGSQDEQAVDNLYLLLFDETGSNPIRYYIDDASTDGAFAGGEFNVSGKKISLNMTRAEAGARQVYLVANIEADMKTALDAVTTVSNLQNVFRETAPPWSDNINTPILMSGSATHNFITQGAELSNVHLIRAIAKIELNIKLSEGFQVAPTIESGNLAEYKFRYVDFDTRTYVMQPLPVKLDNLVSSSADAWPNSANWSPWKGDLDETSKNPGLGYTVDSEGKVTDLKLITYLNERDVIGAKVDIELPRVDDGPLPPPEFGPELYTLPLPEKVERNHWYVYDIEI